MAKKDTLVSGNTDEENADEENLHPSGYNLVF